MSEVGAPGTPEGRAWLAWSRARTLAAVVATPSGLGDEEAARRLEERGPNEPAVVRHVPLVVTVLRRFVNPLVAILLVAAAASAFLGEVTSSGIIALMVVLGAAIDMVQTRRSDAAARALRERVAATASVLRGGAFRDIPRRDVVPGDVLRLEAGDVVGADARLLDGADLHVQEGALTGESLPVEKNPRDDEGAEDASHVVFMGTSVVSGKGTAVVVRTGAATEFGQVASALSARPTQTEFERGIRDFGLFVTKTVLFLVLFVVVANAVMRRDALEGLLFAVALAVGLTPEFLPMIVSVTLARGAVRMARQKVIVKNLAAIQNLGSVDILCSDKTGTLTTGHMVLESHVDAFGASSERPLLLACINSYFETGVDNPLDAAVLRVHKLDPLDSAVLAHEHPDLSGWRKVDEIPFDFERRRVSVLAERPGERLLVTKGAAENVLEACAWLELDGREVPLDAAARARCAQTTAALGAQGFRVVAVAWRALAVPAITRADERDLRLAGFLAFADPPRDDAAGLLAALARAGVGIKIVTGDSGQVAAHVCTRVGLAEPRVLLGPDIEGTTDTALARRAEATDVFARVTPAQKTRVIRALRSRGHVVGYIGDGINDAPSLRAADVGISVESAVDVAKDAADIILLERGLGVVHAGVMEGRRAFGNVLKYLLMGTSSAFGNVFSMAGASAVLPFLPMLPPQVLLNNFLYDVAQLTIPSDEVDEAFLLRPRRWDIGLVRRFMLIIGPVSSVYDFLTFWVLLRVFHAHDALFHTGWFVESLATQTLVIFVIRSMGGPRRSRPSRALVVTTLASVAVAIALPWTPLASALGFVPLPPAYFAFLAAATATYLWLVGLVERRIFAGAFG